eukprot:354635-Chlamydomonas_euryale.AAC.3
MTSVLARDATTPPTHSQLLLIGDSGVGKSCLLLRFAVSGGEAPRAAAREPRATTILTLVPLPRVAAGRHLHRELHLHHRRRFCKFLEVAGAA